MHNIRLTNLNPSITISSPRICNKHQILSAIICLTMDYIAHVFCMLLCQLWQVSHRKMMLFKKFKLKFRKLTLKWDTMVACMANTWNLPIACKTNWINVQKGSMESFIKPHIYPQNVFVFALLWVKTCPNVMRSFIIITIIITAIHVWNINLLALCFWWFKTCSISITFDYFVKRSTELTVVWL